MHQEIGIELDAIAKGMVDAAFKVHKALGPGLLESAYQACMEIELERRGVPFAVQELLPISYEGVWIEGAYRIDLLVGGKLVVELKAVEKLLPVHQANCSLILSWCALVSWCLGGKDVASHR